MMEKKTDRERIAALEAHMAHLERFLAGYTREVIKFNEFLEEWGRGVDFAIDRQRSVFSPRRVSLSFNFLDTNPDGSPARPIEQG